MKLVDRETFTDLDVPQMVPRLPAGGGGGGGGQVRGPPGLALLHGPVDGHGPAGEVLQLLDAGLTPEVGWCGQRSVAAPARDPGVGQHLLRRQSGRAVLRQQLADQSPGQQGDVLPVLLGEDELALADVVE